MIAVPMLCVMIVRRHTNSTVTRWGLQIGLQHIKGTIAYCSDHTKCRQHLYSSGEIWENAKAQSDTVRRGAILISIIKAGISIQPDICIQSKLKSYQKHVGSFSQLSISLQPVKLMSFGNFALKIFSTMFFCYCIFSPVHKCLNFMKETEIRENCTDVN